MLGSTRPPWSAATSRIRRCGGTTTRRVSHETRRRRRMHPHASRSRRLPVRMRGAATTVGSGSSRRRLIDSKGTDGFRASARRTARDTVGHATLDHRAIRVARPRHELAACRVVHAHEARCHPRWQRRGWRGRPHARAPDQPMTVGGDHQVDELVGHVGSTEFAARAAEMRSSDVASSDARARLEHVGWCGSIAGDSETHFRFQDVTARRHGPDIRAPGGTPDGLRLLAHPHGELAGRDT